MLCDKKGGKKWTWHLSTEDLDNSKYFKKLAALKCICGLILGREEGSLRL